MPSHGAQKQEQGEKDVYIGLHHRLHHGVQPEGREQMCRQDGGAFPLPGLLCRKNFVL